MMRRGFLAFATVFLSLLAPAAVLSAPIHDAAKSGDLSMIKRLLNRGVDIDLRDAETGGTPLFYAVLTGHNDVVEYLLLKGANITVVTVKGSTILETAAVAGNVDAGRLLGKRIGDINKADRDGSTPLDFAIFAGQRDYVAYLISEGALGHEGAAKHPLHRALTAKHEDVAQLLIESGFDVNERDERKVTPLHIASYQGYEDVVRTLIAKGGDVNAVDLDGTTPLFAAAAGGNPAIAKLLLDNGAAVDRVTTEHNTALIPAATRGDVEVLHVLLEAGADPNIATDAGATPLIMAVQAHSLNAVAELLKHKANVNSVSIAGDTALTVAALSGQREIVETLLQYGANINVVRIDGTTALDLSVETGNDELADFLRAQGAVRGKHGDTKLAKTRIEGSDSRKSMDIAIKRREHPLVPMAGPPGKGISHIDEFPTEGYTWQLLPVIDAKILMPKDWHLLVETNDKVDAMFLSREDISDGGMFLTGLTINAVRRAGVWSGRSVDEFARREDQLIYKIPGVKIDDRWTSDQSGIKQYGVRYRTWDSAGTEYTAMRLSIVNEQSRSVYFLTFESLGREWPESEKIGQTMIESLRLNSEY